MTLPEISLWTGDSSKRCWLKSDARPLLDWRLKTI
jgi:hypothetical protein